MFDSRFPSRRIFLQRGLTAGAMLFVPAAQAFQAHPKFTANPFSLGVASGDPWPDSVILWTRLAPDPVHGGGMPRESVAVEWRVATDEQMKHVVAKGTAVAEAAWAHSVHVDVCGLEADRWYWYQFSVGTGPNRVVSPTARTRTAPAKAAQPDRFAFAFVSCQKYESGHYTALRHLCDEDLSLVLHLGDYIYEKGPETGVREMPLETCVTLGIGQLARIHLLDTRQHRTDQPCGDGTKPTCAEREGPSTMMGPEQEAWLGGQLAGRGANWNVLAQQVIFSQIDVDPGPGQLFMMDKWDGYPQARRRLVGLLVEQKLQNVVVLSADNHNNWAIDVKRDFDRDDSAVVASEFSATSLTSGGDGADMNPEFAKVLVANPHVKLHNSQRGYVRCVVTSQKWHTDYRVVPYVSRLGAPIQTRASFTIESGRAGLQT